MTGIPGRDIFASASGLLCSLDLSRYLGEIATKDRRRERLRIAFNSSVYQTRKGERRKSHEESKEISFQLIPSS